MVSNGESFCSHTSKTSTCSTTDAIRCTGIFDALKGNHTPRYSVKGELTYTWITLYTLKKKVLACTWITLYTSGMHTGCTQMYMNHSIHVKDAPTCTRESCTHVCMNHPVHVKDALRVHSHAHDSLYTREGCTHMYMNHYTRESWTLMHMHHFMHVNHTLAYTRITVHVKDALTRTGSTIWAYMKHALTCTWIILYTRRTHSHAHDRSVHAKHAFTRPWLDHSVFATETLTCARTFSTASRGHSHSEARRELCR